MAPHKTGSTRPIRANDLKAGDILFKHASDTVTSWMIKKGQAFHYPNALATLRHAPGAKKASQAVDAGRDIAALPNPDLVKNAPSEEEATDITHVAVALGPDDAVEFDETGDGRGFVRGPMTEPSRLGKKYEVYRCMYESLWARAADKASLVWDLTHATDKAKGIQDKTPLKGSYGRTKMLTTAVLGPTFDSAKGPDVSLGYFEKTLADWLAAADKKNAGRSANTNIQFFCSNFVLFCYLWAAAEWQDADGDVFGLNYVLGKKASIAPVELYVRIKAAGQTFFRYAGTMET